MSPHGEANTTHSQDEMQINPQRAKVLAENLSHVVQQIQAANKAGRNIRLVAVSKLKPANDILALHNAPTSQLYFGENYAQELQSKAAILPHSIRWCFIGGLQTNKCKSLAASVPNLFCVSSVDSEKKANELDKGRKTVRERWEADSVPGGRLRVQVQVNTSGEQEKSGVEPDEAAVLCRHIRDKCENLELSGLMTIGALARSQATTEETENEDFICLRDTRDKVCKELGLQTEDLELSMGMSADFEGAISMGSNEVRVGSTIFGERPAKKDAKVREGGAEETKS